MDIAITMEQGLALGNERPLESALAFLASRSKKSARELSAPVEEVFKGFASIMDQLLLNAIEKRTSVEFNAAFHEDFPKYAAISLSLSGVAHAIVPQEVLDRLTRESICEMEADFRDNALSAFGASVKEQAMFTVWTLRKISDLLAKISGAEVESAKEEEDKSYRLNFAYYTLRANFGLDCLNMAIRLNRPVYPEVMEELKNCLRAMVDAYAWARRSVSLRVPSEPDTLPPAADYDEEEEQLLAASMQDMASATFSDESY